MNDVPAASGRSGEEVVNTLSQNQKMTGEAPEVRSDKRKHG